MLQTTLLKNYLSLYQVIALAFISYFLKKNIFLGNLFGTHSVRLKKKSQNNRSILYCWLKPNSVKV